MNDTQIGAHWTFRGNVVLHALLSECMLLLLPLELLGYTDLQRRVLFTRESTADRITCLLT